MAEDDEIDVLGDFSFNSCFAQNNQGIPSCSNREDTVHPQWLLDSTANNWERDCLLRRTSESSSIDKETNEVITTWNQFERDLLVREMAKYGRNIRKISETIKTKTEAEIHALIEAEYGVNLETPVFGLDKNEDDDEVPAVVQEEIVTDDISNISTVTKRPFRKKTYNSKSKSSLLKSNVYAVNKNDLVDMKPSEIFYEEDLIIGSTESIGSEMDLTDIVSKNISKYQKVNFGKKIGNHRRKMSRNYDKGKIRNRSKDLLKSPLNRQRKDSSLSEDSLKSPKMQILLGSGQALPVSEGEQVIKIEKKKDSEPESDIDIDVDSDVEDYSSSRCKGQMSKPQIDEAPLAVPLRKFEPMPRRKKKINLDGGGGFTIMHTESGDLVEVASEPRKERQTRKQPIHLIECRIYNADRPAPFSVSLHVSALISMDVHGHLSRGEVMGLVGGVLSPASPSSPHMLLTVAAYRPAAAAAGSTHCDMDPVSQALAGAWLRRRGRAVCGWHHSHPTFACAPSRRDLHTQRALQRALAPGPCLALLTSQHWPVGRAASQYRCIRVEDEDLDVDTPAGYRFNVKLVPDLTLENLSEFLAELTEMLVDRPNDEHSVDMNTDICPEAKMTYLEKCISSVSHHIRSAGYGDDDPLTQRLLQGIRDVFR
ncbi:unnamed protein product [Diatraea saccharalis]|uniref:MPN domain-containing protein n=1 Tax=Diatraea saccharalis TaxID=40085 RepID=A0A9N9QYH0_9NEOP|nr:unnamed protein product [Diatraea saccharalis]